MRQDNSGGCPPPVPCGISRRQLLQVGGLSLLSLGLPELLGAEKQRPPRRPAGPARSCILIVQQGGPSHLDTWDLKPDAPVDIRGPFRPIRTRVAGIHVGELLPRLAGLSDRYCLIRSMRQPSADHLAGMHICLSGRSNPPENAPYLGSIVARLRPATRNLPAYVWLQNMEYDAGPRYQTGGSLGQAYAPLRVGTYLDNPSAPGFRFTAFDPPAGVSAAQLAGRRRLLAGLDRAAPSMPGSAGGETARRLRERAFDLVTGPEARQAFDLSREPARVCERYGLHPLGQNLLLARRLIEAGVRLVSIHAWTGVAPGAKLVTVNIWDGHGGIDYIGNTFGTGTYGLGFILPRLDQAVSALLEDLGQRGLLGETLVAMLGEFGRSPTISKQGRDHWPHCYSAMLAGGGVRGGQVYGMSDRHAAYVKDSPVSPEDFGATLLSALGIAPGTRLAPDGFTNPASTGQVVPGILG
jgi:hypothetical protein